MTTPGGGVAATTATTTPGGYTSRFVAHVAHGQAHQTSSNNSSNPRNVRYDRSRTFSDGNDVRPSAGRVEDDRVTADYAFNAIDDGDALRPMIRPQTNATSSHTDGITDTDRSTTTSSHSQLAISPDSLLGGSRIGSRVASVAEDEALAGGRAGNDGVSLAAVVRGRDESAVATDGDTAARGSDAFARRKSEGTSSSPRDVARDDDNASVAVQPSTPDPLDRSVEPLIDERRDRSKSKESRTVSESSSCVSGQTVSDESESESESESGSEEEDEDEDEEEQDEEEDEDDESRDENCNLKKEKKEEKEGKGANEGSPNDKDGTKVEEVDGTSNSDTDGEATVLSVSSNTRAESSVTPDDYYERDLKRRSASIIDERSIEEMFDDNGWVITEQDLQTDDLRTESAIPSTRELTASSVERPSVGAEDVRIGDAPVSIHVEELIPGMVEQGRDRETFAIANELGGISARSSIVDNVETVSSNEPGASDSMPRSRVYRQSSLGKNGWLVSSDESENESDRAMSPYDATRDAVEREGSRDSTGSIDENGWVIIDDNDDDDIDPRVGAAERPIRFSETADLVTKANAGNGALLANATQSKATAESADEYEEPADAAMSIPMQMVTTVFCVSVLCYSVLMNLFL